MNNKLISDILSVSLLFSMFAGSISADASELIKETFDGETDSKWTAVVSGSGVALSAENGYLKAVTAAGGSNRACTVNICDIKDKTYLSLSFDFKAANCNSTYAAKHGVVIKDSKGSEIFFSDLPESSR